MSVYFLTSDLYFPPVSEATPEGILAIGGDLAPERLLLAYHSGIFPWFDADEPILWWSPPERMVVDIQSYKIPKGLRTILSRNNFTVTFNQDFKAVISNCQTMVRKGQHGTWITDAMLEAYCTLHETGHAQSVEVWQEDSLVGGLYGVDLGHIFCGESMFSKVSNASKAGFAALVHKLQTEGYKLLDCQIYNNHLKRLGAFEISRADYLQILKD